MKKILFLLLAVLLGTGIASAQGNLLNELKNAAKREAGKAADKAKRDARNTATTTVRGAVDRAKNDIKNGVNNRQQQEPYQKPAEPPREPQDTLATQYEGDFVPGGTVIFEDLLEEELADAKPSRWRLLHADDYECKVVSRLNGPAISLRGYNSDIEPALGQDAYLPEAFTVEMDIWSETGGNTYTQYLDLDCGDAIFDKVVSLSFYFCFNDEGPGPVGLEYRTLEGNQLKDGTGVEKMKEILQPKKWNRAALSYDHGTFAVYVNGVKVLEGAQAAQPTHLRINTISAGCLFKNFRVCAL